MTTPLPDDDFGDLELAQLRAWVALPTRDKVAFFEEMVALAHASGALAPERLALRDLPVTSADGTTQLSHAGATRNRD